MCFIRLAIHVTTSPLYLNSPDGKTVCLVFGKRGGGGFVGYIFCLSLVVCEYITPLLERWKDSMLGVWEGGRGEDLLGVFPLSFRVCAITLSLLLELS